MISLKILAELFLVLLLFESVAVAKAESEMKTEIRFSHNFNGVKYMLFKEPRRTWLDAVVKCVQEGAMLTSLHSDEELEFLFQLIKKADVGTWVPPWLGGNDIETENLFKWVGRKEVIWQKFLDAEEIPIHAGQNCVVLNHKADSRRLQVIECSKERPFICQSNS